MSLEDFRALSSRERRYLTDAINERIDEYNRAGGDPADVE